MTELDIEAIEARANAATKGPWKRKAWTWRGKPGAVDMIHTPLGCLFNDWDGLNSDEDGEFIVHAREDVPALVAEVRRLRAALAASSSGENTQ